MRFDTFDRQALADFEIGAGLFGTLAWPGPNDYDAQWKAAEALCARTIRLTCEAHPNRAEYWRSTYPEYAAVDEKECRRRLRTFVRRLRDRMTAARMALGYLQEARTGQPAILAAGMARLSLNELSKLVMSERGLTEPEMLERHVWRQSLPVIHLAAAFQMVGRMCAIDGLQFACGYPLDDANIHAAIINLAADYEQVVLGDKRFGVDPGVLIRVRHEGLRLAA